MRPAGERAPLRVALLGCGVVGSQVYRLLTEQSADLKARAGATLQIAGVAVREIDRPRAVPVDPSLLTTDGMELATRPDVDIVIERGRQWNEFNVVRKILEQLCRQSRRITDSHHDLQRPASGGRSFLMLYGPGNPHTRIS